MILKIGEYIIDCGAFVEVGEITDLESIQHKDIELYVAGRCLTGGT